LQFADGRRVAPNRSAHVMRVPARGMTVLAAAQRGQRHDRKACQSNDHQHEKHRDHSA
jgi:hypothetical protein